MFGRVIATVAAAGCWSAHGPSEWMRRRVCVSRTHDLVYYYTAASVCLPAVGRVRETTSFGFRVDRYTRTIRLLKSIFTGVDGQVNSFVDQVQFCVLNLPLKRMIVLHLFFINGLIDK